MLLKQGYRYKKIVKHFQRHSQLIVKYNIGLTRNIYKKDIRRLSKTYNFKHILFQLHDIHTYIYIYTHITKGLERKLKAYLVHLLTIFSCTNVMALIQFQM